MTMVPIVPINPEQVWHTLPINVTNGNVGNNIDYSFVNMSNNKHLFTALIIQQQHFHLILHPNHHRVKIAFPKLDFRLHVYNES